MVMAAILLSACLPQSVGGRKQDSPNYWGSLVAELRSPIVLLESIPHHLGRESADGWYDRAGVYADFDLGFWLPPCS